MKPSIEKKLLRIVSIASVGSGLEMYDFVIYAFFAPIIGKLFFPKSSQFTQLLSAFGVFAIGYFIRPIGAVVFGHFGDTIGRKKTLLLTILIMATATVLIGCLPTYQQIGIYATLLLILLRLLQGFAVGGDFPGAITFVAEHVPATSRGLHCSWIYTGINLGLTSAAVISSLLTNCLSNFQIEAFGWRIGFWFGLALAGAGFYLRTLLPETPNFLKMQQENIIRRLPAIDVFKNEFQAFLIGLGVVCLGAIVIGHMLFMTSYLHLAAKMTLGQASFVNTLGTLIWSLLIVISGWVSDKIGRKPILYFSSMTLILFSYSLFHLLATGKIALITIALVSFAIFMSGIIGVMPSILSELFSTPTRNSGIGITYNLGFALFCSVTPLIMTKLISQYGLFAPSYWIIFGATITLITTIFLKETAKSELG